MEETRVNILWPSDKFLNQLSKGRRQVASLSAWKQWTLKIFASTKFNFGACSKSRQKMKII